MPAPRSLALLLLGLVSASGQQPVEPPAAPLTPPPAVPIPGFVPPPAAAAEPPAAQPPAAEPQPGVPLGETKITTDINEPKLSGNALAGLYRKYTGRRVIISAAAATAEFSFVQEATPQDPLTFAEAAELLKKAATIENFVFVPDEQDHNLDILTLSTGGIRPTGRGVDVYNENTPLPEGDAVISYVMSLSYIKPAEAVNTFTQIIGQFGAYGSIAPVPNASAIVITENTSLIRKLIDLKKEIDKPSSQVGTRFIKVQYADVTEIATTLTDLLTAQQSAQKTAGIQRADAAPAPAAPPGGNAPPVAGQTPGGSGEETPVQIIPDPRTNRIFAMGRPVDLLFVEGLVREFDVETSEKNFLRRKLKFLKVADFLDVANDALTRAFSGTGEGGGGTAGGAGNRAQGGQAGGGRQTTQQAGGRQQMAQQAGGRSSGGGGGGGGAGGGTSSGISSLGDPDVSTAPDSILVGRTLLVADNITNSIVVQGPPSGLEIIERLLDQIDVKADQVMISCVFGQLGLTDNWSFGMDYARTLGFDNRFAGRGGAGGAGSVPLSPPAIAVPPNPLVAPFDPGALTSQAGLGLYGLIGNNLHSYLNAKQDDSNFKVLSRPTIFTANNQKGTIVSGTQIAVPTSSYSYSGSSNPSTNFEYKDVALKLEVIPLVNSHNEVTLQVYLTSDDVGNDRPVGTGESAYSIPDILKRELVTTVTVPNNQTIVLGGLITESQDTSRTGIPLLSRIPGIGPLFGSKEKNKDRSELLIFIQPSIVHDANTMGSAQADMDHRYETSTDTRKFSDGPQLPPVATPVPDKEGAAQPTTTPPAGGGAKKSAPRPAHRK